MKLTGNNSHHRRRLRHWPQDGEIRARWAWTEPEVWTERMLATLETGIEGLPDQTATLELHRSDAKHLQAAVDAQKRRVIEAGGVARQSVYGIWSAAHLQRRSNAIESIRAAFDLRKCPVTAETLAQSDRGYLASRDLEYFFTASAQTTDDRVAALRELPGRFAVVRKIAEDTPNLDLAAIFPEPAVT